MNGFARHRPSGRCVATFSAFEADLLRSLAGQLIELLRSEEAVPGRVAEDEDEMAALERMLDFAGPTSAPDDPVLARFFPNAYSDDDEAAADFRRFTEQGLRSGKAAAAAAIIDTLEDAGLPAEPEDGLYVDVELDEEMARTWLRSFTDMRLAIGTRLEITDDDEAAWEALPEEDPRSAVHDIYLWLGFLQETLVMAVTGDR